MDVFGQDSNYYQSQISSGSPDSYLNTNRLYSLKIQSKSSIGVNYSRLYSVNNLYRTEVLCKIPFSKQQFNLTLGYQNIGLQKETRAGVSYLRGFGHHFRINISVEYANSRVEGVDFYQDRLFRIGFSSWFKIHQNWNLAIQLQNLSARKKENMLCEILYRASKNFGINTSIKYLEQEFFLKTHLIYHIKLFNFEWRYDYLQNQFDLGIGVIKSRFSIHLFFEKHPNLGWNQNINFIWKW
jgi:hypothetical protein